MSKQKYIFNPITGRFNVYKSNEEEMSQVSEKVESVKEASLLLSQNQIVKANRFGAVDSDKVIYTVTKDEYKKLEKSRRFFVSLQTPTVDSGSANYGQMTAGSEPVFLKIELSDADYKVIPLYIKENVTCVRNDIASKSNLMYVELTEEDVQGVMQVTGGVSYLIGGEQENNTNTSIYPANATVIEHQTSTLVIGEDSTENYAILDGNGAYEIELETGLTENKHVAIWLGEDSTRASYTLTDGNNQSHTLTKGGYVDCFYSSQSGKWNICEFLSDSTGLKRFKEIKRIENGTVNAYTEIYWGDLPSQLSLTLAGWGMQSDFFKLTKDEEFSKWFHFRHNGNDNDDFLQLFIGAVGNGEYAPDDYRNSKRGKLVFYASQDETRISTANNGEHRPLIDGGTDKVVYNNNYGGNFDGYDYLTPSSNTGTTTVRKEYTAVYGTFNPVANPEAQGRQVNYLCRVGESYAAYYQQKGRPLINTNRCGVFFWGSETSFTTGTYKRPVMAFWRSGYYGADTVYSAYRDANGDLRYNNHYYYDSVCGVNTEDPDEYYETAFQRESCKKSLSGWFNVQYEDDYNLHHCMVRLLCGRKVGASEYYPNGSTPETQKGLAVLESNWKATHIRTMNNGNYRPLIDGGADIVHAYSESTGSYTDVAREWTAIYGTHSNTANAEAKNANVNFFAKIGDDYCTYYQVKNRKLIDASKSGGYVSIYGGATIGGTDTPVIEMKSYGTSVMTTSVRYDSSNSRYVYVTNSSSYYSGGYAFFGRGLGSSGRILFGESNLMEAIFQGLKANLFNNAQEINIGGQASYQTINIGYNYSIGGTYTTYIGRDCYGNSVYINGSTVYIKGKNFQTEVLDKIATLESQNSALSSSLSSAQSALTAAQSNITTLQSNLAAALQRIAALEGNNV